MCIKNCVKVFPEGGGFGNITVTEGGPTATGMNPEGGTVKKKLLSTPSPRRLISGTALISTMFFQVHVQNFFWGGGGKPCPLGVA